MIERIEKEVKNWLAQWWWGVVWNLGTDRLPLIPLFYAFNYKNECEDTSERKHVQHNDGQGAIPRGFVFRDQKKN